MSGFSYGVIEVTQGADDANATPRSQVAAMISTAGAGYYANTVALNNITAASGDVTLNTHKLTNVVAGAAGTDGTNLTQVQALITAATPARIYGGVQKTNGNVTGAVTEGVWTDLPGTFIALTSSGITNTGAALTYTATASHKMNVMLVVTLSQDQVSANMLLTFFLNGSQYGWSGNDVITEEATLAGITYQLTLTTIIPLTNGDVLTPKVTLTGASGNVTNYSMQFFVTQAD